MSDEPNAHSIPTLNVAEHMLDRLLNVYGEPEVASIDNFMDEYTQQLKHFDAEELSVGCKILLGTFKYKRWPRPAECIDACMSARSRIKALEAAKMQPKRRAGKTFNILTVRDLQFKFWIEHLDAIGQAQVKDDALSACEIAVTSRYPTGGMDDFVSVGPFTTKEPETYDGLARVFDSSGRQVR